MSHPPLLFTPLRLRSIELRNRLERVLGMKLSATVAWNYPTVRELAGYVLSRLTPEEGPDDSAEPASRSRFS